MQTRDEKCYAFLAFFAKQKATLNIKINIVEIYMEFHSYSPVCPFKSIEDIKEKHVTVMGLGLNGGG